MRNIIEQCVLSGMKGEADEVVFLPSMPNLLQPMLRYSAGAAEAEHFSLLLSQYMSYGVVLVHMINATGASVKWQRTVFVNQYTEYYVPKQRRRG